MDPHILEFCNWLKTTPLSYVMIHYKWVWATCETLHFIGLALLFGTVGLIDLRMLGVAKQVPFGPLNKLVPWGVGGVILNGITGVLFFSGDPVQYATNQVFQAKLLFITIAGLNLFLFFATGVYRKAELLQPGEEAPALAKVIAAVSLISWITVTWAGRMLPFLGTAF